MKRFLLALVTFATFAAFAGNNSPPLPPGYKPTLVTPRQLTATAGQTMSRAVFAPPATNAPATLVIRGWYEFQGERLPRVALQFHTNAPHATIYTRTWGTNWQCSSQLADIRQGQVRDFSWCPTAAQSTQQNFFRVVLHD